MSAPVPTQKHILFILEYFYPHIGGVETLFGHLTEALVTQGYRVTVVTLWLPGCLSREIHHGVEIIRIRTPQRARRYLFMLLAIRTVIRLAPTADIIHTTTYCAAIPAWFGARWARKPAVLTVHEVFGNQWNNLSGMHNLLGYAYRAFEWAILHLPFTRYICDSEFTARRLRQFTGVASHKVSTIYPAVDYSFWDRAQHQPRDLRSELGLTPATPLYLYFGRPGISKGVEYLIEAARTIRSMQPDSRGVLILAHDPLVPYQRILRRIASYDLGEHLMVLDPVPRAELPSYLLAADCIVVPSISEGFGYSAVEAATINCPVITTTGHSVEEVLTGSACFVPPRDPTALAEAVLTLFRQRPEWNPPERFEIESHIKGVQEIYAALL